MLETQFFDFAAKLIAKVRGRPSGFAKLQVHSIWVDTVITAFKILPAVLRTETRMPPPVHLLVQLINGRIRCRQGVYLCRCRE